MNNKADLERRLLSYSSLIFLAMYYTAYVNLCSTGVLNDDSYNLDLYGLPTWLNIYFPYAGLGASFILSFELARRVLRRRYPCADPYLLPTTAFLTGTGWILLLSVCTRRHSLAMLPIYQMAYIAFGCVAAAIFIDSAGEQLFKKLSRRKYIFVVASAALIMCTMLLGSRVNGKSLWLFKGHGQTIEIVKVMALLFMAGYMYEYGVYAARYRELGMQRRLISYFMPFAIMLALAVVPVIIQGDLGPSGLIILLFLVMFYLGTGSALVVFLGIAVLSAVFVFSYKVGIPSIVNTRVDMWLMPFSYGEGTVKALWAEASGGLWGAGPGRGMSYLVPEVQSDYNFTALCEEMGYIFTLSVVAVYTLWVYRGMRIAMRSCNKYKKLVAAGASCMFGLQTLIIIAGNLNAAVMTGITLPFISYGGSSMLVNFCILAAILIISGQEEVYDAAS
jgi:cell division protein FtsW (lipid II flippase)